MRHNRWKTGFQVSRWRSSSWLFSLLFLSLIYLSISCTQVTADSDQVTIGNRNHTQSEETTVQVISYEISPQATDPQINDWLENHYVVAPSEPARNQLMVFFSGSFGQPSRQQTFTKVAAQRGFHAINLMYPNRWTVADLCRRNPEDDCTEKVRREIIQGKNLSSVVNVSAANSINNRLRQALRYLDQEYPEQGWGQYLEQGEIKWSAVTVTGHSQGGGHAAMLGKLYPVNRVIMLAAPGGDFDRRSRSVSAWLAKPGATSPERYFGFVHVEDPGFRKIMAAWQALGLDQMGDIVDVDDQAFPYQNSHQLVTSQTPGKTGGYHASVATDAATPTDMMRRPIFQDVWEYLLGV